METVESYNANETNYETVHFNVCNCGGF